MAIAGIILGWIGVATLLMAIAAGIYVWKSDTDKDSAPPPMHTTFRQS